SPVAIRGPYGKLSLDADPRPAVFLAGGIGITPFRSMALQARHDESKRRIWLFYSNRTPEDGAFLAEFATVEKENRNFRFVPVLTGPPPTGVWQGEAGHISIDMLSRHLEDPLTPVYYVAGPQRMVAAMRRMLTAAEVSEDSIRAEEFSGY